ncbi:5-hydroxytryptamine receptor 2A-like isoform X2 [Littorina saxatilis]
MPLSLVNEMSVYWYLGRALCDMWVSMDVLCCTASILHLVAIAVDRYWAVSNIDYVRRRCARQILVMIAMVWLVSVAISIPPLFGWRNESDNPELSGNCMISQDHGYTIFSTVGAFYCPLVLMLVLNFKIYRAARYRIRRKGFAQGARGPAGHVARGHHAAVPVVHVEVDTEARTEGRGSSGSDVSNDGISMYRPSCVINELSRADMGLDSTTGDYENDQEYSIYPGDSTTDSNPPDSYFPVDSDDPDSPIPLSPTFTIPPSPAFNGRPPSSPSSSNGSVGPASSETLSAGNKGLCVESSAFMFESNCLKSEYRTLSCNHLTVPNAGFLAVPGSTQHLNLPDASNHVSVSSSSDYQLGVPEFPIHIGVPDVADHELSVPDVSSHVLSVPDVTTFSCVPDVLNHHNCVPQDSKQSPGLGGSSHIISCHSIPEVSSQRRFPYLSNGVSVPDLSNRLSVAEMNRRNSFDIDLLKLRDNRHLAVPESSDIDSPEEPAKFSVPDCVPCAPPPPPPPLPPSDCRLVQFDNRVRIEGDTDHSDTSNSLKPGEDETGALSFQGEESGEGPSDSWRSGEESWNSERRESGEETPTTCCTNRRLLSVSCVSSRGSQRHKQQPQQAQQQQHPQHQYQQKAQHLTLETPVINIRKDSCSQYMSEARGAPTPSFNSGINSPSTTTTTTSGTYNSSQGGNQLSVPGPGGVPVPQQAKSRGNNNTKRARNREKEKQRREKLEMRRERKAARVLGIITGAFVLCWLPFFMVALIGPFLPHAYMIPQVLFSLFLWLGYFNSLINPVIYTVFNPSFRNAFRKIFFRRLRSVTR